MSKSYTYTKEEKRPYNYIFSNNLESATVQPLLDIIHQHDNLNIWFSSIGGYTDCTQALIHALSENKDSIKIYLQDRVYSSAALILLDFFGEIFITENFDACMFHMADFESYNFRKGFEDTKKSISQVKEYNIHISQKLIKFGLTNKEVQKFLKGEDVFWYRDDFKEKLKKPNIKFI